MLLMHTLPPCRAGTRPQVDSGLPYKVNSATLAPILRAVIEEAGEGHHLACNGGALQLGKKWINDQCRRLKLSMRAQTNNKKKLPENWFELVRAA